MNKKIIDKKIILSISIIILLILALMSPADYIASTLSAFILYAKNVLPVLFPFMFFGKLLTMIGTATSTATMLASPLKKIYNAPPICGYISILSLMCGYPLGAKLTQDFYSNQVLTESDCLVSTALSNFCGPIFIIGTVGSLLADKCKYAYIIYFSHLLGTFLNALIYRQKSNSNNNTYHVINSNYDNILANCMYDSIISIASVGGYIAIMSFATTMFDQLSITKLIYNIFVCLGISDNITKGVFYGLFEMTKGIAIITQGNMSLIISIPIITFLVSFGGLCIALQSMSFLAKCKVKTSKYLLVKFTQAIICSIISFVITLCFIC